MCFFHRCPHLIITRLLNNSPQKTLGLQPRRIRHFTPSQFISPSIVDITVSAGNPLVMADTVIHPEVEENAG